MDEIDVEELERMIYYISGSILSSGRTAPEQITAEKIENAFIKTKEIILSKEKNQGKLKSELMAMKKIATSIVENMPELYSRKWNRNDIQLFLEEAILPEYTGEYDKSKIENREQNLAVNPRTGRKAISFEARKNGTPYTYEDLERGKQIAITNVGTLNYIIYNGAKEYIYKYKIKIINDGKVEQDTFVYSNIDRLELDRSPKYRDAVINSLLSKNNIKYSNCNGYIGSIEKKRENSDYSNKKQLKEEGIRIIPDSDYYLDSDEFAATAALEATKNMERNSLNDERE